VANGLPWKAYEWNGTAPAPRPAPERHPRELVPCPSEAAWGRHMRGTDMCADPVACRAAYLADHSERARIERSGRKRAVRARIDAIFEAAALMRTPRAQAVLAAHELGELTLG
jgi:hypothetical protein